LGRLGENGIENGSKIKILRVKTQNEKSAKSVCQSGMTVRPCDTVARVCSTLEGTTVCPVGTAVPTPLCPENLIFDILEYF